MKNTLIATLIVLATITSTNAAYPTAKFNCQDAKDPALVEKFNKPKFFRCENETRYTTFKIY